MVIIYQSHFEFCEQESDGLKMTQNMYSIGTGEIFNYIGINCEKMKRFTVNRMTNNDSNMSEDIYLMHLRKKYPKIKIEKSISQYGPFGYLR